MKYERMTHRMLMMRMDVAFSGCSTPEDRNDDVPEPSTLIPTATVPCPDAAGELMASAWLMLYAEPMKPACVLPVFSMVPLVTWCLLARTRNQETPKRRV